MAYLIDGHNLIGQLPDISLTDPDDEAKLVQKLLGFTARTQKRIIVVFDGGLPGGKSRMTTGKVEVIFATARSTADTVMKERIKRTRDAGQWIVVSNDREVLAAAHERKIATLTSAAFAAQLKQTSALRKAKRKQDGEAPDVYVSPAEVEAWLKLFNGDDQDE